MEIAGDLGAEQRALDVRVAEVDAAPDARVDGLPEHVGESVEAAGRAGLVAVQAEGDPVGAEEAEQRAQDRARRAVVAGRVFGERRRDERRLPGATGVAGSNNGVQPVSATVSGFPSLAASRTAVTGRQVFQRYLLFQQPIAPSAPARSAIANIRALSAIDSPRSVAIVRKARFQSANPWSCQKIAASV